jgi:hypothetical protein
MFETGETTNCSSNDSYESTLSSKYGKMNYMKGFCLYNEQDYSKRLDEEERQRLLRHHTRNMYLLSPLNTA